MIKNGIQLNCDRGTWKLYYYNNGKLSGGIYTTDFKLILKYINKYFKLD